MQLSWTGYSTFLAFSLLLTIVPGPDLAVVMKSAITSGRPAGLWTTLGVNTGNAIQGTVAALGLGALIVASRPLFETIRWAGAAYLCWLALQALRSAWQGPSEGEAGGVAASPARNVHQFWQGLLSDLTNPKILVFFLSVLPQFMPAHGTVLDGLVLANTLAILGACWFSLVVLAVHAFRSWLTRRAVRRALDGLTGLALAGFAGKVVADST